MRQARRAGRLYRRPAQKRRQARPHEQERQGAASGEDRIVEQAVHAERNRTDQGGQPERIADTGSGSDIRPQKADERGDP